MGTSLGADATLTRVKNLPAALGLRIRSATTAVRHEPALWAVLALAIMLGTCLRLYNLGTHSLWNDELSTWNRQNYSLFSDAFWSYIRNDVHPPGYVLLMHFWCNVVGDSEVALRLPSALSGIAMLIVAARVAASIWSLKAAAVVAMLLAVSPHLIYYSQEARAYVPVAFANLLSVQALLGLLSAGSPSERKRSVVTTALACALSAYLHYTGLLASVALLGCALVWSAVSHREKAASVGATIGLALALYLPWFPTLLEHLREGGLTFIGPPTFAQLTELPAAVLPNYVYVLACLFIGGAVMVRGRGEPAPSATASMGAPLLFWWLVLLAFAMWGKSVLSAPIYNARNVSVLMPPLVMLLAGAVGRAGARVGWTVAWLTLCTGMVLYQLVELDKYWDTRTKQDFRAVAAQGARWSKKHPTAPIVSYTFNRKYMNYYLKRFDSPALAESKAQSGKMAVRALKDSNAEHAIVLAGHIPLRSRDIKALKREFSVVKTVSKRGAKALLLKKKLKKKKNSNSRRRRKK